MSVSLRKSPFPGVRAAELAQQIKGHQKLRDKVPQWHGRRGLIFPPTLNLEQASSEATARYKSELASGKSLLDITGGLGVDCFYLANRFTQADYFEQQPELAELAAHNLSVLGADNLRVHSGDGLQELFRRAAAGHKPDWVYADPARRHAKKGRVVRLRDYQPDIPANLQRIRDSCENLLVKSSPMLDLQAGQEDLPGVCEIHIVSVENEVKELLWWVTPERFGHPRIVVADLFRDRPTRFFAFTPQQAASASSQLAHPATFLYEPSAALMKSGAFDLIGARLGVSKLHPNTHLYTSSDLIEFPGRRFAIREVLPYKPGKLPFSKANVSTRNFPESAKEVCKRNRIQPGGTTYLFFATTKEGQLRVLHTEKI